MLAPAKINLALHVTGQRPDRYHLIESLSVFADVGDEVEVCASDADSFACIGERASPDIAGPDNLCLRARDALRSAFPGQTGSQVRITLHKRLPVASGVGGGSSDAAATLKLLAAHWRLPADAKTLARIATPLGADLPMCLAAAPLIARGVGDEIEPLAEFPALDLVLANPGVAVATPEVFRRLARKHNPPLPPLPARRDASAVIDWLAATRNDLQPPAIELAAEIPACLDALADSGAIFSRMSGSGATCFGVFADRAAATLAATRILRQHPGWFVAATRTGAAGE